MTDIDPYFLTLKYKGGLKMANLIDAFGVLETGIEAKANETFIIDKVYHDVAYEIAIKKGERVLVLALVRDSDMASGLGFVTKVLSGELEGTVHIIDSELLSLY